MNSFDSNFRPYDRSITLTGAYMRCCIGPASKLRAIATCTRRIPSSSSISRRRYLDSIRAETVTRLSDNRRYINTMSTTPDVPSEEAAALPKLSASEFREYNRLAEHMDHFVHPLGFKRN